VTAPVEFEVAATVNGAAPKVFAATLKLIVGDSAATEKLAV
jgi:hypothetical protein